MTNEQKNKIAELRSAGMSYAKIGTAMGLSKDTVKSYCRRNHLSDAPNEDSPANRCKECGAVLIQVEKRKNRLFCSKECREKWWHSHPEQINQKAVYKIKCNCCGTVFESYGNKSRKYCSHTCYINARFKGGDGHE